MKLDEALSSVGFRKQLAGRAAVGGGSVGPGRGREPRDRVLVPAEHGKRLGGAHTPASKGKVAHRASCFLGGWWGLKTIFLRA